MARLICGLAAQIKMTSTNKTIRASVDEAKFFASVKHIFSGSTTFVTELMQNARRAGAQRVHFDLDEKTKTLCVTDDGSGIEDFAKLLEFCGSGWDEKTQVSETPFGMGMYSVYFAGATTTICSKGQQVTVKVEDILARSPLSVVPSDWKGVGTHVIVQDLDEAILLYDSHPRGRLFHSLERAAMGFPIDVGFNGDRLPFPHAERALSNIDSPVGRLHLGDSLPRKYTAYLQGLPIGTSSGSNFLGRWTFRDDDVCVVHLDNQQFSARMPDRSSLYDAELQSKRIEAAVLDALRAKLASEKMHAVLTGDDAALRKFVKERWDKCIDFGVAKLLNDIPYVPSDEVRDVDCVTATGQHVWTIAHSDRDVIHADELVSDDKVLAVRNAPTDAGDHPRAALMLTAMAAFSIVNVDTRGLDEAHWLFRLPSADDIDVQVQPVGPTGREFSFWCNTGCLDNMVVRDCSAINLKLKHRAILQSIELKDDWIVCEHAPDGTKITDAVWDSKTTDILCYVTGTLRYGNLPSDVGHQFSREHLDHVEEDRDETADQFLRQLRAIRNETLRDTVATALAEADMVLTQAHVPQLCLVGVKSKNDSGLERVVTDANRRFFAAFHRLLMREGHDVPAAALQAGMTAAMLAVK